MHCRYCRGRTYLIARHQGGRDFKCSRCGQITATRTDALEPEYVRPTFVKPLPGRSVDQLADLVAEDRIPLSDVDPGFRGEVEKVLVVRLSQPSEK